MTGITSAGRAGGGLGGQLIQALGRSGAAAADESPTGLVYARFRLEGLLGSRLLSKRQGVSAGLSTSACLT